MRRVLPAETTVFAKLQLVGRRSFVLGGGVIATLTLRTGQRYNNSHLKALLDKLFDNFADYSCTDSSSAFTDREAETLFHGDRSNQFTTDGDSITRHDHLYTFR